MRKFICTAKRLSVFQRRDVRPNVPQMHVVADRLKIRPKKLSLLLALFPVQMSHKLIFATFIHFFRFFSHFFSILTYYGLKICTTNNL